MRLCDRRPGAFFLGASSARAHNADRLQCLCRPRRIFEPREFAVVPLFFVCTARRARLWHGPPNRPPRVRFSPFFWFWRWRLLFTDQWKESKKNKRVVVAVAEEKKEGQGATMLQEKKEGPCKWRARDDPHKWLPGGAKTYRRRHSLFFCVRMSAPSFFFKKKRNVSSVGATALVANKKRQGGMPRGATHQTSKVRALVVCRQVQRLHGRLRSACAATSSLSWRAPGRAPAWNRGGKRQQQTKKFAPATVYAEALARFPHLSTLYARSLPAAPKTKQDRFFYSSFFSLTRMECYKRTPQPPRDSTSPPSSGLRRVAYQFTRLPTRNAFLNLGITAFVVFLVAKWLSGREYEAYLISTIYSILYLGILLWASPQVTRE
nr:hypothetical protein [Pandoravirus massiliensis]